MTGRFQVFGWRPETDGLLRWRLISENGRQLALSPNSFATFDQAVAAALATRLTAPEGAVHIASEARAGWGWALHPVPDLGCEPQAISGRRYARRVELMESIARFRLIAASAEVSTASVVFRRGATASHPVAGGGPSRRRP